MTNEPQTLSSHCFYHPSQLASGRCHVCADSLCDACLPYFVSRPAPVRFCKACGAMVQRRQNSRRAFGLVFALLGLSLAWKLAGLATMWRQGEILGAGSLVALPLIVLLALANLLTSRRLQRRPRSDAWRTKAHNVALSGKFTVGALGLSFAVTALVVPFSLHLPRWVEGELVLGGWWAVPVHRVMWKA